MSFRTERISKWKPLQKEFRESRSPNEMNTADTEAESSLYCSQPSLVPLLKWHSSQLKPSVYKEPRVAMNTDKEKSSPGGK